MTKIYSGIKDLDNLLDSLYIGDNVVWEVEAGTAPELFILNFIRRSFSENRNVIYVSFNKSPHTIFQKIGEIPSKEKFILLESNQITPSLYSFMQKGGDKAALLL
jgi:KaiC/GvpD/RAD55 family RecA-like ATPase